MAANFEFTDKTQTTIESAVQLAKDYANAQGMLSFPFEYTPPLTYASVQCILPTLLSSF